jgi:hypothetical protein
MPSVSAAKKKLKPSKSRLRSTHPKYKAHNTLEVVPSDDSMAVVAYVPECVQNDKCLGWKVNETEEMGTVVIMKDGREYPMRCLKVLSVVRPSPDEEGEWEEETPEGAFAVYKHPDIRWGYAWEHIVAMTTEWERERERGTKWADFRVDMEAKRHNRVARALPEAPRKKK